MEELALPTCAIQLSGEVLSTNEAASAELCEAEAVHRTRSSHCLFKAVPTTPCVCREQQLETGLSNKRLKHTLELLLHCGGPAEPRLLRTAVPHIAAVVWTGTAGTRPAHNNINTLSLRGCPFLIHLLSINFPLSDTNVFPVVPCFKCQDVAHVSITRAEKLTWSFPGTSEPSSHFAEQNITSGPSVDQQLRVQKKPEISMLRSSKS